MQHPDEVTINFLSQRNEWKFSLFLHRQIFIARKDINCKDLYIIEIILSKQAINIIKYVLKY